MKSKKAVKRKQKNKKEGFFKRHYSLSWDYIKESGDYILFIILVFLVGFVIALNYQPPEIIDLLREFIERILAETEGLNLWQMTIYILNNNLKNSFFAMLLGVFLGVFPFFTAWLNGYVLGFVVEKSVAAEGFLILWRLVPHGIFELPAVFLALALGVRLGFFWCGKGKIKKEFLKRLEGSLRVFLFIILPLLIIASVIEGILIFMVG